MRSKAPALYRCGDGGREGSVGMAGRGSRMEMWSLSALPSHDEHDEHLANHYWNCCLEGARALLSLPAVSIVFILYMSVDYSILYSLLS